ncbi:AAA family ATPase [Luteipulveratus sp. YIM 133132]|uniref:AAA family ATPase n=1 Tax=Luteipulveratus flavus TaxID=3031728 RepID=UPI0023B1DF2B|nr:AAA family ATPase [Luteipulveratus sp. YIM 133132]MDE9366204.1 AAA family ATPase [Luteipulveratus sp. YIM 133132]
MPIEPHQTRARVVLIVGVPGAGKTTVARALAGRFPRSACIEGDLIQHELTVNGLVPPGGEPISAQMRETLADRGWWIDTSDLTVEQTVEAIVRDGLRSGQLDDDSAERSARRA